MWPDPELYFDQADTIAEFSSHGRSQAANIAELENQVIVEFQNEPSLILSIRSVGHAYADDQCRGSGQDFFKQRHAILSLFNFVFDC